MARYLENVPLARALASKRMQFSKARLRLILQWFDETEEWTDELP